jgi:hypothetical protein
MLRPMGWVVQYRLRWYERALLGYGVFIGLFFAVVSLGAFGYVVARSLDGTLLSPAERTATAIGTHFAIALFALWFGSFALRWSFGSLVDLFGAEVVLYGPIEELEVHRGSKGRCYSAVVAGATVELPSEVFGTLAKGDRVWMRVGRFQRSLKELARPDRLAPPRAQAHPQEGAPAAPAAAPPIATDAAAAARAKAHGPIANDALRRSDVPASTARWTELERFALTYDGARGPELFALHERHALARTLPEALTELRAILYLEQRRHRHAMRAPTGEELARVRAIIEAIRARVPADT